MTIKIRVTRERYDEVMSIDDSLFLFEMTDRDVYLKMCEFVVNESGEYIGVKEARKLFKNVPRKDLGVYVADFLKAIGDAFVPPTNGAA